MFDDFFRRPVEIPAPFLAIGRSTYVTPTESVVGSCEKRLKRSG
jgi:hypothetical protein